jgi:hypothetical protein
MLPTISEDEAVDFDAGTPSPMSTGSGSSYGPTKFEQQEQQIEAELDAEEMLLAAIDLRLQQLLQLRDQRQAAAAQRAACNAAAATPAPTAPAAQPALPVWYGACASPNTPTAAPMSAADASFDAWSPAPQLMQQQVCQQLAVSDAAVLTAASKLQQIQAVQRMQLALQQELLELLTSGC